MSLLCEDCKKPFPNVNEKEHHKLTEHSIYKGGEPILEGTEQAFDKAKRIVMWILRNRKGATGLDALVEEWYRADFLKVQHYDAQSKGFIQDKPITFEIIHSRFSPDSLIRARQAIQEQAYIRIMECIKRGKEPDRDDVALLPSTYTQLKRRRREEAMTVILGANP